MANQSFTSSVRSHLFRLQPEQDLKRELANYCKTNNLQAASVSTVCGSLKSAQLRMADGAGVQNFQGPFEIASLVGTISSQGLHLHIALADSQGQVIGGHLMDGCPVYTTAEIVLLEHLDLAFDRIHDQATGYRELVIQKRS